MSAQPTTIIPPIIAPADPRSIWTGEYDESVPDGLNPSTLRAFGLHTASSLNQLCASYANKQFVVDKLIARESLNFAAGDSGLGKSPLFYQLGLCVAAGIPWLGLPTTKGTVIYVDFENGELQSQGLRDSLLRHLGLEHCPDNFLMHYGGSELDLIRLIRAVKPSLVIVDTLRAYRPDFEEKNSIAGSILKEFRSVIHQSGTAILWIHHTKKPGEHGVPSLEDTPPLQWLNQASGARAMVNQMDFRLGIDLAKPRRSASSEATVAHDDVALVLRGQRRLFGEFGPIYVSRCFDEEGEPIGYKNISGVELLPADQQRIYDQLPPVFTFSEAQHIYGKKSASSADNFLKKCVRLEIVRKLPKGYEKVGRR
jgi:AAA domain